MTDPRSVIHREDGLFLAMTMNQEEEKKISSTVLSVAYSHSGVAWSCKNSDNYAAERRTMVLVFRYREIFYINPFICRCGWASRVLHGRLVICCGGGGGVSGDRNIFWEENAIAICMSSSLLWCSRGVRQCLTYHEINFELNFTSLVLLVEHGPSPLLACPWLILLITRSAILSLVNHNCMLQHSPYCLSILARVYIIAPTIRDPSIALLIIIRVRYAYYMHRWTSACVLSGNAHSAEF